MSACTRLSIRRHRMRPLAIAYGVRVAGGDGAHHQRHDTNKHQQIEANSHPERTHQRVEQTSHSKRETPRSVPEAIAE